MKPEITYTLDIEPEGSLIRGSFDSGDAEADEQLAQELEERLNRGDLWAWCTVRVTARCVYQGVTFEGHDYLGGCSYAGEQDFKHPEGYYPGMCNEARADLIRQIAEAAHVGNRARELFSMLTADE